MPVEMASLRVSSISLIFMMFFAASAQTSDSTGLPLVCFIVRTYWGHGDAYVEQPLRTLLTALQAQDHTRWEALMVVLDHRPFPDLRRIVRDLHDDRIWVHAELVHYNYVPKKTNSNGRTTWAPGYHDLLYNLTDKAIRACAPSTEWVVVTNGDNNYDPHFVERVVSAPPDTDIIAFNFYSRYQRPTADPCVRFAAGEGLPMCKENGLRFCQTDLAANAYRWRKMLAEDRRFGVLGSEQMADGVLSEQLLKSGWKILRVSQCLVNHGPSPQQCAMLGGVWDDSRMASEDSFGGECVDKAAARRLIMDSPARLEIINIDTSHDPHSFFFPDLLGESLSLACIRLKDPSQWMQAHVFGALCHAPVDRLRIGREMAAQETDVSEQEDEEELQPESVPRDEL